MKTVKESDLRRLIWDSYLHWVHGIPMLDAHKQLSTNIHVDVNSVCINLYDKREFNSEDERKESMKIFADYINDITFGNLKVVDMGCNIESKFSWVHIANAYESLK